MASILWDPRTAALFFQIFMITILYILQSSNFQTRLADVARVTKQDFELCNEDDPLYYATIGPTYFNITSPGDHFFISTLHNNCLQGMKLAISATVPASHHEHGRGSPSLNLSPASAPSPGVASAAAGSPASLLPASNSGGEERCGKSSPASFTATFYLIFSSVAAVFFGQI